MKITKISLLIVLFCLLSVFIYTAQTTRSNQSPEKNKIKVTFIELGSVNCVPCKMMQPVMEQIKKDYAGVVKVIFYDVWTPEQRSKAQEYQIRAIPTQIFLDDKGKEFFRHVGYFPIEDIEKIFAQKGVYKNNSGKKNNEKK